MQRTHVLRCHELWTGWPASRPAGRQAGAMLGGCPASAPTNHQPHPPAPHYPTTSSSASRPPPALAVAPHPLPLRFCSCCVQCGRVLEDTAFSADVTFAKDAGGESAVVGQFVSESGVARGIGRIHGGRVYAYQADSHEKAQQRGRHEIAHLVDMLSVRPREESVESGGWVSE